MRKAYETKHRTLPTIIIRPFSFSLRIHKSMWHRLSRLSLGISPFFDTRIFPFETFPSSNILCCWCICLCQPHRLLPWAVCSSDVPTTALNIFHNIIQFPFPQLTRVNNRFDSAFFQSFALCRSRSTYLQHPWPDWWRELWMRLIGVTLSRSCSWSWLWPKKANWISFVLIWLMFLSGAFLSVSVYWNTGRKRNKRSVLTNMLNFSY